MLVLLGRFTAWLGLTAVGVLHFIWASGSPWPAKKHKKLAEAVVGNSAKLPNPRATALVGVLAVTGAAIAGGALGEGQLVVFARRFGGMLLLGRAALGGEVALAALGLGPASGRFRALDRRIYRPFCAVVGLAAMVGARRPRQRRGRGLAASPPPPLADSQR